MYKGSSRRRAGGRELAAHSMFCTCSRIWSISTFSSTAALRGAASTDLEPSVLASRLNSCSRKSRRRPTGSLLLEDAADLDDVAVEAVELLVHVELLQRQHQLLLQPARVDRLRQVGQPRFELGALAARGSAAPASRTSAAIAAMPSTRSGSTAASLAPSRSRAATKSSSTASSSASASACSASASIDRALHHARELQQLGELTCNCGKRGRQALGQHAQLADHALVDLQRVAALGRRAGAGPGRACRARRARPCARAAAAPAHAVRRAGAGPVSRKRWLTARSSQASVPPSVARSPEAKAVMLRIMASDAVARWLDSGW